MIRHLVVPTLDRPALLARCVESFAAAAAQRGRDLHISVLDDSATGGGTQRRQWLVDELVASLSEGYRELLEYALLTPGRGAARNVQQLANVGRWYASADDDTVATIHGGAPGSVASCTAEHDPTFASCFETRAEALAHDQVADEDPFVPLEFLLAKGATVAQLGQVGDSAMGRPSYLAGPPSFAAVATREVCRRARHYAFTSGAHFMAVFSAYDGARDLPPFYPIGRGEDAVFGQLIAGRGGLIGHAPYAIVHDPNDVRPLEDEDLRPSDTWFEDERFVRLVDVWPEVRAAAAALVLP